MPSLPDHLAPAQQRPVALARAFLGTEGSGHLDARHRVLVEYSWPAEEVEAAVAGPVPLALADAPGDVEQRGMARVCLSVHVPGAPWQDDASEDWGSLDIDSAGVVSLLQRYGLLPAEEETPCPTALWPLFGVGTC